MNTRKLFAMFFLRMLIIIGTIFLIKVFVEPFGSVGNTVYGWESHNFTQNPRTVRNNYLDRYKNSFTNPIYLLKKIKDIKESLYQESYDVFIPDDKSYTKEVPILMFHDIDDTGDYSVSEEQFKRQMKLIKDNGFNTILFEDLYEYTLNGIELTENPIMITFDDGYQSNYDIAYPILKELNMKATIYIIGTSIGKDTYKDTGKKIIPHFGYDEAIEMYNSGLIDIQSHSFDMHQSEKLENDYPVRVNLKSFDNESEEDYIQAFNDDFAKENNIINKITSKNIHSFSYPTGYYSEETEKLLNLLYIKSTVTSETGVNTVTKGIPQSLFELKRMNIYKDMPDENLIKSIIQ